MLGCLALRLKFLRANMLLSTAGVPWDRSAEPGCPVDDRCLPTECSLPGGGGDGEMEYSDRSSTDLIDLRGGGGLLGRLSDDVPAWLPSVTEGCFRDTAASVRAVASIRLLAPSSTLLSASL